jgi:hypothetical protein
VPRDERRPLFVDLLHRTERAIARAMAAVALAALLASHALAWGETYRVLIAALSVFAIFASWPFAFLVGYGLREVWKSK